jgi:hypothetical protein
MSKPSSANPVKLIAGFLSADRVLLDEALQHMSNIYGQPDWVGSAMEFNYTDYYEEELGTNLLRRFASFDRLIKPESLPDVKLMTNALESEFSHAGKRRVNIDPGYLSEAHLILATCKGYAHRPYLREGIYADLTLIYKDKAFHPLQWTYPDYADAATREDLRRIREKYLIQIRAWRAAA